MSNDIPWFCMDVIIYPHPNPGAGFAKSVNMKCPKYQTHRVAVLGNHDLPLTQQNIENYAYN